MYSKIITPEKQYYIGDFTKIGQMIVYTADMVNRRWDASYKAGKMIEDFNTEIKGLERTEITEKEFDTAKLRYKEFTNKIK